MEEGIALKIHWESPASDTIPRFIRKRTNKARILKIRKNQLRNNVFLSYFAIELI